MPIGTLNKIRQIRNVCLLPIFVLAFFVFVQQAHAFAISPAISDIVVERGQETLHQITIKNESTQEKTFFLKKRTFTETAESGTPLLDKPGEEGEVIKWVSFSTDKVTIPARTQKQIGFSVNPPQVASAGSHFLGIFVSDAPPRGEAGSVNVVAEVGSLWSITIPGDVVLAGEIKSFERTESTVSGKQVTQDGDQGFFFETRLLNDGTVLWRPRGTIMLKGLFDVPFNSQPFNIGQRAVLPKTEQVFFSNIKDSMPLVAKLIPWRFSAELDTDTPQGERVAASLQWWHFAKTQLATAGVLVVLILLLFIRFIKKRRKKFVERTLRRGGKVAIILLLVSAGLLSAVNQSFAQTTADTGTAISASVPANDPGGGGPGPGDGGGAGGAVPETTITISPVELSNSEGASFSFISSEAGSTFECLLDANPFGGCTSPQEYDELAEGEHTFQVRATKDGQTDATPASYTWTIDTVAPSINDVEVQAAEYSATSAWNSEAGSTNVFVYIVQGGDLNDGAVVSATEGGAGEFSVEINGLFPGITYAYIVRSTDAAGNTRETAANTFETLADTTPPANPNGFTATPGDGQVFLAWTNPPDLDFTGIRLIRKLGGFPANLNDGDVVLDEPFAEESGTKDELDDGLINGTEYFYALFAYDGANNFSTGVLQQATPVAPPVPAQCNDGIDNDDDNLIDFPADPDCDNAADDNEFFVPVVAPQCDDGIDNDGDGLVDFPNDPGCANLADEDETDPEAPPLVVAQCSDGNDNDGDGFIDFPADPGCENANDESEVDEVLPPDGVVGALPQCNDNQDNDNDNLIDFPADPGCENEADTSEVDAAFPPDGGGEVLPQCNDNQDNDNDNLIDFPADPGCTSPDDNQELDVAPIDEPEVSVPDGLRLKVADFEFLLASKTITAIMNQGGEFSTLPRRTFSVRIEAQKITKEVDQFILNFNKDSYLVALDKDGSYYYVDVVSPSTPAVYGGSLIINYKDKTNDVVKFTTNVKPLGHVKGKQNGKILPIEGAKVLLLEIIGGKEAEWPATRFGQANPKIVGKDGSFGFIVPKGQYRFVVSREGFKERRSLTIRFNNVAVREFELLALPKKLGDINFDAPATEVVSQVFKNVKEQTIFQAKQVGQKAVEVSIKIVELADVKEVEDVAERIVAPVTIGVVTVSALPALQLGHLIPFLRFVFLQPVFLFGRRKRKGWGVIYNSLTKRPLDLAMVRLTDAKTGRLVQSHVTDIQGRYAFLARPGAYRIEVRFKNFLYPSSLLGSQRQDSKFLDLYHGEPIVVKAQNTLITANIPLDPPDAPKRPVNIMLRRLMRKFQKFIAFAGFALTIVVFIITPTILVGSLVLVHVILYFVFKRIAIPAPPKSWGIVYDKKTKSPLGRVVARIFDTQYNKLLETQLTDAKGRYSFLVGQSKYYVTFEKTGYETIKSNPLDLTSKKELGKVALHVGLDPVTARSKQAKPKPKEKS